MTSKIIPQFLACFALGVPALLSPFQEAKAQGIESHPVAALGEAIEVSGYPIGEGEPSTFRDRRQRAFDAAINEVKAEHGEPMLTEVVRPTHALLSYPGKLVAVSGWYSNSIVCRVEVETSKLRFGFTVDKIVSMAARSCRKAEEDGWGDTGLMRIKPIGSGSLQEGQDYIAKVYATDADFSLFPSLVREKEILSGSRAGLVRERTGLAVPVSKERDVIWRYAWFDNSQLLVQRYRTPPYSRRRDEHDLVCTIALNSQQANHDVLQSFSEWCDRHTERLLPALESFVGAVLEHRNRIAREEPPGVIAVSSFHIGEFPAELTTRYWETGEVEAR